MLLMLSKVTQMSLLCYAKYGDTTKLVQNLNITHWHGLESQGQEVTSNDRGRVRIRASRRLRVEFQTHWIF